MFSKAIIKLDLEADELTTIRFAEAINQAKSMFASGFLNQQRPGCERVFPISADEGNDDVRNVECFVIQGKEYEFLFKTIARLVMERNLVGDKYKIVIDP